MEKRVGVLLLTLSLLLSVGEGKKIRFFSTASKKLLPKITRKFSYSRQIQKRKNLPNSGIASQWAGKAGEKGMTQFYRRLGYQKVPSKVGGNRGIDGIFIKRDPTGKLKDVVIVESKVGSSRLGKTGSGVQMSKNWILTNLQKLKAQGKNKKLYSQIEKMVKEGKAKFRLWQVKFSNKYGTPSVWVQKIKTIGAKGVQIVKEKIKEHKFLQLNPIKKRLLRYFRYYGVKGK